jgi:hypothetical protein
MPEATIDKNCHTVAREDDIRLRPSIVRSDDEVLAKAKPATMKSAPEPYLRQGVSPSVPPHGTTSSWI